MERLRQIYGWPHEALHVLALWLVGRRAVRVSRTDVVIPEDLTTGQFVFVAGLPALVFGSGTLLGVLGMIHAATAGQLMLGLLVSTTMGLGTAGTVGDVQLILLRLAEAQARKRDQ